MALIQLRCPNCNGSIQMDDTKEAGFCMYCGSKFMVQDEARRAMQYATVEISREKELANLDYRANQRISQIISDKSIVDAYIPMLEDVNAKFVERMLEIDARDPRTVATKNRIEQLIRERKDKIARSTDTGLLVVVLFIVALFVGIFLLLRK